MTTQQFDARWQRIHDEAGTALGHIIAKRDQEIAILFTKSGWTQQKIADHLGKGQQWVSRRLIFGRFCMFLTPTGVKPPVNLTERKFRGFWSESGGNAEAHTPAETKKFQAIVDCERWELEIADAPKFLTLEGITENCVDNRYRTMAEISDEIGEPDDGGRRVCNCIDRIKRSHAGGLMVMSKPFAGGVPKFRFKKIKNKDAVQKRAVVVIEELSPIVDELGRCLAQKWSQDAMPLAKAQLSRLQKLIKKYS